MTLAAESSSDRRAEDEGVWSGATVNSIGIHIQMCAGAGKHACPPVHARIPAKACVLADTCPHVHAQNKISLGWVFGVVRSMGRPSPHIKG